MSTLMSGRRELWLEMNHIGSWWKPATSTRALRLSLRGGGGGGGFQQRKKKKKRPLTKNGEEVTEASRDAKYAQKAPPNIVSN